MYLENITNNYVKKLGMEKIRVLDTHDKFDETLFIDTLRKAIRLGLKVGVKCKMIYGDTIYTIHNFVYHDNELSAEFDNNQAASLHWITPLSAKKRRRLI